MGDLRVSWRFCVSVCGIGITFLNTLSICWMASPDQFKDETGVVSSNRCPVCSYAIESRELLGLLLCTTLWPMGAGQFQ